MQETESSSAPAKSFRDLKVWQKAHQWVLEVYQLSSAFPPEEKYGLTSQLRRSAVSVPANIVEGFRRRGSAEKGRFPNVAEASLEEARYFLLLARDLKYFETCDCDVLADEVGRMLSSYRRAILNSNF